MSTEADWQILFVMLFAVGLLGFIAVVWRWARSGKSLDPFDGLELKAISYRNGQFEFVCFKPKFLETLRIVQDGQHRPW